MPEKKSVLHIGGSVERALKGDYHIDIKAILNEAWQQTLRARVSINLGLGFALLLGMLVSFVTSNYLGGIEAVLKDPQASMILNVVVTVVIWPFVAGVEMMGVLHAIGMKTQTKLIFSFLKRGSWVALCALLTSLVISIGFQLLILPGVFLAVVLSLTIPLVVEKKMTPMKAIMLSVQALRFKWFQIFALYSVLFIGLILLILPIALLAESELVPIAIMFFLIGLSFLAPLYYNVKGVLYREIFGVMLATDKNENLPNTSDLHKSTLSGSDDTFSA